VVDRRCAKPVDRSPCLHGDDVAAADQWPAPTWACPSTIRGLVRAATRALKLAPETIVGDVPVLPAARSVTQAHAHPAPRAR
jgi:hypothetical protein